MKFAFFLQQLHGSDMCNNSIFCEYNQQNIIIFAEYTPQIRAFFARYS